MTISPPAIGTKILDTHLANFGFEIIADLNPTQWRVRFMHSDYCTTWPKRSLATNLESGRFREVETFPPPIDYRQSTAKFFSKKPGEQ